MGRLEFRGRRDALGRLCAPGIGARAVIERGHVDRTSVYVALCSAIANQTVVKDISHGAGRDPNAVRSHGVNVGAGGGGSRFRDRAQSIAARGRCLGGPEFVWQSQTRRGVASSRRLSLSAVPRRAWMRGIPRKRRRRATIHSRRSRAVRLSARPPATHGQVPHSESTAGAHNHAGAPCLKLRFCEHCQD